MPVTRRTFLRAGAVAAGGVLFVGADGFAWEPNHPRLVEVEIRLKRLPPAWAGLRIVQMSDFHYDPHFSVIPLRHSIGIVNNLRPDLIVLTGDFVTAPALLDNRSQLEKAARDAEPCAAILSGLHPRLGIFAALGNHDGGTDSVIVTASLAQHGFTVLQNRSFPLEQNGARLWLAGIDDVLQGQPDLDLTLHGIPQDEPIVLLAHEPDIAVEVARHPVDLQLSGHSHGGQVWVPLLGAPWLPPLGRKFPHGMYHVRDLTLYTNVGLGTVRIPVRLNCPPEITLITLQPGT